MEAPVVDATAEAQVESVRPPAVVATPAKKPQATFGSFSSAASPFATAKPTTSALSGLSAGSSLSSDFSAKVREANNLSTTPKSETPTTPAPVKKPQATFGAFSSSASPFSAVKSSSAFASQPVASSSNATTGSSFSSFKNTVSNSSAFGGWSSGTASSPFASPAKKTSTADKAGDGKEDKDDETDTAGAEKPQASFGDILAKSDSGPAEEKTKVDLEEQQGGTRDALSAPNYVTWLIRSRLR